ncbi:MAG: dienelactone hydrolase family protein [Gemmatimonadetes bacterium]|nr:dienelactone hydrolase family protein [Gemmatimonadota bacterium]
MRPVPLTVPVPGSGDLPALLLESGAPSCLLALAHGAGAGMAHPFMEALARRLSDVGVSTLRFQFPYMAAGSRRPDRRPVLVAAWEAAVGAAAERAGGLPLLAGGKSMGGRMASHAAAEDRLGGVRGLVFVGFPLHPARRPGTERADHLADVRLPMLFLQGTRDALADLDLLRPVLEPLGERATLHVVDGADHGFHVLKRSGRSDEDVLDEMARTTAAWARSVAAAPP